MPVGHRWKITLSACFIFPWFFAFLHHIDRGGKVPKSLRFTHQMSGQSHLSIFFFLWKRWHLTQWCSVFFLVLVFWGLLWSKNPGPADLSRRTVAAGYFFLPSSLCMCVIYLKWTYKWNRGINMVCNSNRNSHWCIKTTALLRWAFCFLLLCRYPIILGFSALLCSSNQDIISIRTERQLLTVLYAVALPNITDM